MTRIYWQSFVDTQIGASYLQRLSEQLNAMAAPGTRVDVFGQTPPARDFGRLSEFRCAVQALASAIKAEQDGYDVFVLGHFQDPGLYELRSTLRIPVVGTGEATLLAASTLGRRFGLVTLDPAFEVWHHEQVERYGLSSRLQGVTGLGATPQDFDKAFAGDQAAKARLFERITACAEPLVAAGAEVIVPAGVLPGLLIGSERGFTVGHAPVINCAAVALKSAEMWAQLHAQTGIEPSRGPSFRLAGEQAKADFLGLLATPPSP